MKCQPFLLTARGHPVRVPVCLTLMALAWGVFASRAFAADYTVTTNGNAIVVTNVAGNGDTLTMSEPSAGSIQFAAAGRTFSVNGGAPISGNSGILSRSNVTQITVNAGAGADTINIGAFTGTLPGLTVNGGKGDDTVNFNGNITFASGASLNVDLQNDDPAPGADVVNVSGNLLASGTGTITVKCSMYVSVNGGASLQTTNGNLVVEANQQAVATSGSFNGVNVGGGLRCTGTGQVMVKGRGGDDAGGYQLGVNVAGGGQIIGGTSGLVTVIGTGGASTNIVNRGVTIYGSNSLISSVGGPVQVTGQGGSLGAYYSIGISMLYGGVISAAGPGTVTVTGTGAGGGGAGLEMSEPGTAITSAGGAIQVTGTPSPVSGFGITAGNQCSVFNTNVADSLSIISDSIAIANNVNIAGTGKVTLKPKNNGTLINLGGADAVGTLGLTDAELDRITANTIVIGDTNAGSITISAPISLTNAAALSLISGGAIRDTYAGGPDVTVTNLTTSGNLAPGTSTGIFSVAGNETLAANSTFTVEIGGITPGTQHDQLSATGSVSLGTNVTLSLLDFGGFIPIAGQNFTIISRTGGSGTFAGLPQGAILLNFLGTNTGATISYTGGTGDDVVLTAFQPTPPMVLAQPAGTNAPPGSNVTLCVTASGPFLSYQWRRNGVNIPGATNSCLTLTAVQAQDGGTFDVVISNPSGAIVSGSASVIVTVPVLTPGDNLANRVPLAASNGTVRASNVNATRESGEPMHVGKPGGASVWYSFTAAFGGVMSINTAGSSFDTLLAVYTGATIPALVEVASDEDSGGALTSALRFNVTAGAQYDIVVDGYGGAMGNFVLSWSFQQTAQFYPVIVTQPTNITVAPGSNHTFTVSVTGAGLTYQWFFNGNPLPGATTNSLTLTNIQAGVLGTYFLRVTNSTRSLDSRPVSLQINLTDGVGQPAQATDKFLDASLLANPIILGTMGGSFSVSPKAPSSIVAGYTGTQVFNTYGSVNAVGEPPICGVRGGASTWLKLVAEQSGQLYLNTDGSSFDTVVEVFERIIGVTNLHSLGCDDNHGLDHFDSALVVPVVAGRTNFIDIDGVNGATGVLTFNYNLVVPSTLTAMGRNGLGQFQFLITGKPGMSFSVQHTTNLGSWTNLFSGTDADGSYVFTDTSPAPPRARFYRLVMVP